MQITWLGHSCFKIESEGYTIITDPYKDGSVPGYQNVRESANLVVCSHEHGDHSGRDCVSLLPEAKSPFTITQFHTYHDDTEGSQRGKTDMTIFDDGKCRAAHLGDLGCALTKEQIEGLKHLDVVMIPVGGFYTIDAKQAMEVVRQIEPKTVIPMHYRNPELGCGYPVIGTVEEFAALSDSVAVLADSRFDTETDYGAQIVVLQPKNV